MQISDENVHYVREIMSEVFGEENFISEIIFTKTRSLVSSDFLTTINDFILWYGKDKEAVKSKMRKLYELRTSDELASHYEDENGNIYSKGEAKDIIALHPEIRIRAFMSDNLIRKSNPVFKVEFEGKQYEGGYRTSLEGMKRLIERNRIFATSNSLRYKFFLDDFPASPLNSLWTDTIGARNPIYVVQTNDKIIQRCLLMTTDPGDLVLDITCGSGTTAYVAENWGRRWITCDTSRVAITLAKQRLMTASFDYYELAYPNEGVGSGFKYKTVPHITLKSIANNEPPAQETLYDQPFIDSKRLRVTGPFTVEAVPAPVAKSFDEFHPLSPPPAGDTNVPLTEGDTGEGFAANTSVARSGETLRQSNWRDELLRAGVRAKGGKLIEFTRVEPLSGTRYLQAEAETKPTPDPSGGGEKVQRVLVCFGPEHAPLEQRMVELALEEAMHLKPKPHIVLFCAFQFDEEAAKDIDETNWPGVTLLKAQMNADLLTDDLKKKRSSNESFWLIGQPDVVLRPVIASRAKQSKEDALVKPQHDKQQYVVEVLGFDYYNPKTGKVESGGKGDIAMWMLDTDYDGRSLFPSQVFFPMAGEKEGWATLAKNLNAEIDEEKIEAFRGTVSLPFTPGKAVAVKIIDARGIESMKIIR